MVTILLEKILSVLEGWSASFASFIIDLMTKLNLIETETANLPDIKTNTDNISSNTDSMTATLANIKTDTGVISGKVNTIDSNTTIIKNNINTISTNVGTASAFCEDTANNTLEIVDKITTIASDTTQLRTNSNSISSDVSEIKNTLGLYLYNTIVTEDSEGAIANFDTDLKDYLQEAKVVIPADVGGISGLNITKCEKNIFNIANGTYTTSTLSFLASNSIYTVSNATAYALGMTGLIPQAMVSSIFPSGYKFKNAKYTFKANVLSMTGTTSVTSIRFELKRLSDNTTVTVYDGNSYDITEPFELLQIRAVVDSFPVGASITFNIQIEINDLATTYDAYNGSNYSVTFNNPITAGAEVDLLSGIVKINTSPITYDSITPIAIRTFKGVNNIYSDIGDMSVTYRETLKHYLEKQNS